MKFVDVLLMFLSISLWSIKTLLDNTALSVYKISRKVLYKINHINSYQRKGKSEYHFFLVSFSGEEVGPHRTPGLGGRRRGRHSVYWSSVSAPANHGTRPGPCVWRSSLQGPSFHQSHWWGYRSSCLHKYGIITS